jgi:hypothetical protein
MQYDCFETREEHGASMEFPLAVLDGEEHEGSQ